MSRLDLRIGVSLPGPLRRAGLPRPEPDASGTGRGGASAAALISYGTSDEDLHQGRAALAKYFHKIA